MDEPHESVSALYDIHHQYINQIPISSYWREQLIPPSNWRSNHMEDRYLMNLYVLGKILYQLRYEKKRLESKLAWDQNWISGCKRRMAPATYYSVTALSNKISESTRELTAVFGKKPEWRLVTLDLWRAHKLKDDLVSDIYVQYPLEKNTKRARIKSLDEAGFHLFADKRAIAGLTETSKDYVNSIWNNRGAETDPSPGKRRWIQDRDGETCVKCCSSDGEHIHHIISPKEGGDNSQKNLALLCVDCHLEAHGGAFMNCPIHNSQKEFWEWAGVSSPDS